MSSESRLIRYARAHLRGHFPHIPHRSGYNRRVRPAGPLIAAAITALARDTPSWHEILRLLDSTPVPCGMSRETVKRSDPTGHAGYGYCTSHSRFFWGFRLYLISTPESVPVIWGLANPKLGEREVTQALLTNDHRLIRAGQVILGDKGFAGRDFESVITENLGTTLVRPDRKDEKPRFGGIRQWIESDFDTLKDNSDSNQWELNIESPGRPANRRLALVKFGQRVAAPGSTIRTDGARQLRLFADLGYKHEYVTQLGSEIPAHVNMPAVHMAASQLKRWMDGTLHHGISREQLASIWTSSTSASTGVTPGAAGCSSTGCSSSARRPILHH